MRAVHLVPLKYWWTNGKSMQHSLHHIERSVLRLDWLRSPSASGPWTSLRPERPHRRSTTTTSNCLRPDGLASRESDCEYHTYVCLFVLCAISCSRIVSKFRISWDFYIFDMGMGRCVRKTKVVLYELWFANTDGKHLWHAWHDMPRHNNNIMCVFDGFDIVVCRMYHAMRNSRFIKNKITLQTSVGQLKDNK